MVLVPAAFTMRTQVVASGFYVKANTLLQGSERLFRIAGPALGGLLYTTIGTLGSFFLVAALAALPLPAMCLLEIKGFAAEGANKRAKGGRAKSLFSETANAGGAGARMFSAFLTFRSLLRQDRTLLAALLAAAAYLVTLGAMRPYLVWLTVELAAPTEQWTHLLSAHGVGALLGALFFGTTSDRWIRRFGIFQIYLISCLLEGLLLIPLAFTGSMVGALFWIAAAGVPEIIAYITYFSIVQQRVKGTSQAPFYAFSVPLFDGCYAVGVYAGFLHTRGFMTLSAFWLFAVAISLIPLLPLARHLMVLGRQYNVKPCEEEARI